MQALLGRNGNVLHSQTIQTVSDSDGFTKAHCSRESKDISQRQCRIASVRAKNYQCAANRLLLATY